MNGNHADAGGSTIRRLLHQERLWNLPDEEIIAHLGTEFSWALNHLCNATPSAEVDPRPAAGILGGDKNQTPSRLLYGKDYAEVNRTLTSILALKWIVVDDYETFVTNQPPGARLQRASWHRLRDLLHPYGQDGKDAYALIVATMVADVGKDISLEDTIEKATGEPRSPGNHDQLALRALQAKLMSPLDNLDQNDRDDVIKGLELAAGFNLSQLAQGENVAGSIRPVLQLKGHRRAFDLKFAETILDVAGAAAGSDTRGALAFAEPVFQTYLATVIALRDFLSGALGTEVECYNAVLQARATLLHNLDFRLLSTKVPDERALLRLLLMGRVAEKRLAETFDRAYKSLPPDESRVLASRLNATGLSKDDLAIIPYYSPALCSIVLRNIPDEDDSLRASLAALMRFLSRACDPVGVEMFEGSFIADRNLSFARDFLQSDTFRHDPNSLDLLPLK